MEDIDPIFPNFIIIKHPAKNTTFLRPITQASANESTLLAFITSLFLLHVRSLRARLVFCPCLGIARMQRLWIITTT
jgi:hypothetical protein